MLFRHRSPPWFVSQLEAFGGIGDTGGIGRVSEKRERRKREKEKGKRNGGWLSNGVKLELTTCRKFTRRWHPIAQDSVMIVVYTGRSVYGVHELTSCIGQS